ncbi:hypothetical protein C8Q78DRAFT_1077168 [Trametes maxima]|nr:hypothetical protein C8Q78DRAFT_1077168 [Trametes maxima]
MPEANQVAVAGPSASTEPPHPIRDAHQVPRFLLKLYQIINDPANNEMIRWSDEGDSFYVLKEERFAREVLGQWFKHQNFSSFVRQLNLYGFRKVTPLQQGILRMERGSESNHFGHPYFRRGQPDLLYLIQRKRPPPSLSQAEEAAVRAQAVKDLQALDVRSIVDGISAIRRQQQAIAADLSALKQSNDALWKEAIEARQRHAKHEDTINRILKFLAGLFGRVTQAHGRDQLQGDGRPPPKRQRLMIGDGRPINEEDAHFLGGEIGDLGVRADVGGEEFSPLSLASERFAAVDTPGPSIASVASPENISTAAENSPQSTPQPDPPPPVWPDQTTPNGNGSLTQAPPSSTPGPLSSTVPLLEQDSDATNPDVLWRTTLQKMLRSPAQYQHVMQAFANAHQPYPTTTLGSASGFGQRTDPSYLPAAPSYPPYNAAVPSSSVNMPQPQPQPTTWNPSWTAQAFADQIPPQSQPLTQLASGTTAVPAPTPLEGALLDNNRRMQKAYRDTAEIHADIDTLQSNIHSLIRDMGLDPHNPDFPTVPIVPAASTPTSAELSALAMPTPKSDFVQEGIPNADASLGEGTGGAVHDLPFEAWLSQLSGPSTATSFPDLAYPDSQSGVGTGTGMNEGQDVELGDDFSAFLDFPGSDPAVTMADSAPSPTGHKRKLDAMGNVPDALGEAEASASKRP